MGVYVLIKLVLRICHRRKLCVLQSFGPRRKITLNTVVRSGFAASITAYFSICGVELRKSIRSKEKGCQRPEWTPPKDPQELLHNGL